VPIRHGRRVRPVGPVPVTATKVTRDPSPTQGLDQRPNPEGAIVPDPKPKQAFLDPSTGPVLSVRFVVALLLMLLGIAWIVYFYAVVRVEGSGPDAPDPGGPAFMADLGDWNYLIGFAAFFLGLMVAAHPATPLGRGRGVVVGMLGCFLIGLVWICVFYVISDDTSVLPVFDDLGQKNLFVGIAFMAVGFVYATRWE